MIGVDSEPGYDAGDILEELQGLVENEDGCGLLGKAQYIREGFNLPQGSMTITDSYGVEWTVTVERLG